MRLSCGSGRATNPLHLAAAHAVLELDAMLLVLFLGIVAIEPATTPLLRHYGFRLGATAAGAAALVVVATFTPTTSVVTIGLILT